VLLEAKEGKKELPDAPKSQKMLSKTHNLKTLWKWQKVQKLLWQISSQILINKGLASFLLLTIFRQFHFKKGV